jgi:maltose-binding protein MalE
VPGKHAPESPASFILSVGRAAAGALVVLGVVAVIAVAATGSNKKPTTQSSTPRATISTRAPTSSPSSTLSTTSTPTATATASTAPKITVNVLNGTTRNGLAGALATKLRAAGYAVKTVATEPKHQTVTTIYYQPGQKAAADALLAAHPELGKVAAAISTTPTNANLTIILGDDYKAA